MKNSKRKQKDDIDVKSNDSKVCVPECYFLLDIHASEFFSCASINCLYLEFRYTIFISTNKHKGTYISISMDENKCIFI